MTLVVHWRWGKSRLRRSWAFERKTGPGFAVCIFQNFSPSPVVTPRQKNRRPCPGGFDLGDKNQLNFGHIQNPIRFFFKPAMGDEGFWRNDHCATEVPNCLIIRRATLIQCGSSCVFHKYFHPVTQHLRPTRGSCDIPAKSSQGARSIKSRQRWREKMTYGSGLSLHLPRDVT